MVEADCHHPLKFAGKLWKHTRVDKARIASDRTAAEAPNSDATLAPA
jgi:hypothetical protein